MDNIKAVVASNIIELRTKAGMTQLELAEKLNYSDKSVSKWERAESIPDVTILKSLADIFGVTVDYLLGNTDIKEKAPDQDDQVQDKNVLRIAGRDGTYIERKLTDEQMRAFRLMVEQLPEADDL